MTLHNVSNLQSRKSLVITIILLEYEANVITKALKDKFALHRVVYNDYDKIIKLLIAYEVDLKD